jgi:hypothetical protein
MSQITVNGRLTTVIVPRKSVDAASKPEGAFHLPTAVVAYVNDVQQAGIYARHEFPMRAVQAFHADYYLAQVNNGGHSQFISNSGAAFPKVVADALAGLEAMGAKAQHQILTEMIAWTDANPEGARAQNGFSIRAKALDELDTRFYASEKEMPIALLAARWISGWPELQIVEDDQYTSVIEQIGSLNPFRAARHIWRSVESIRHQFKDPLEISIAAACGAVEPEPEAKIRILGGSFEDVEGQNRTAYSLATDKGSRLAVVDEAGARLYEYIHRSPVPQLGPNPKLEDVLNYKPPVVGTRLSVVYAERIRQFVKVADETMAPEGIDLLLRAAGLNPAAMITPCVLSDVGALWIVVTEQRLVVAYTSIDGYRLLADDGTDIAVCTQADVEQHASRAAAAGADMQAPARTVL